jgi:hypothetical protein
MPLRARRASVPRILALAAGCSALVEAAHYVLRLDRVSSVGWMARKRCRALLGYAMGTDDQRVPVTAGRDKIGPSAC